MPFQPVKARCRNCKKLYTRNYETQLYCGRKCRDQYNNYGKTPVEQLVRRLNSFMRTEDFREMMRKAVEKEVARVLKESEKTSSASSNSTSQSPISVPNRSGSI